MYLNVFLASLDVHSFSWGKLPRDNEYSAVEPKEISDRVPESREAFFLLKDKMERGFYRLLRS